MRAWPASLPAPRGESSAPSAPSARSWIGPLAGLALLVATIFYVDPRALIARMTQLHAGPIVFGAALVVPQLYCMALRWRLTAKQLGFPISQPRAVREYALSFLLNQLLPFGVAGDAVRALRHAQVAIDPTQPEPPQEPVPGLASALHGVVLERLMGQVVVVVWALATLPLWFGAWGLGLCACAFALALISVTALRRWQVPDDLSARAAPTRALLRTQLALQQLLASPRYMTAQFLLSSAVVIGVAVQLYCALSALGLSLSAAQATQVFPLMLLSMGVPLSFAGFGPREAVTAELYDVLQLSAADGAAFAMAFGAMMVCCSLPCLLLVLWLPSASSERAP